MAWKRRRRSLRCWTKVKSPHNSLQPPWLAGSTRADCKSSSPRFCSDYRL
jgi:hypothetical protein